MTNARKYLPELVLLSSVLVISVLGFWDLYLASDASPKMHHHLHLVTAFIWLGLLFAQLSLIAKGDFKGHRKWGLTVLFAAPLVVAAVAALSVLSAARAAASGEGDMLLVQNVGVTLELALLIVLAFVFRKRRELHGSFLTSTSILFGGIALFFALISFAPMFRIEGPETFYRFGTAAMTGQAICLVAGIAMFATAPKTRWPYLLAAGFFVLNSVIDQALVTSGLDSAATSAVGSLDPVLTFATVFVLMFAVLAKMLVKPQKAKSSSRP